MESYRGAVQTFADAIILFEAARVGLIPSVRRRLEEKERKQIRAGDVFIWDEKVSKMRRWTDGRSWSASRVTGGFLTYREMEPQDTIVNMSDGMVNLRSSDYHYKHGGLIKQSFSITTSRGAKLHLISYTTTKNFTASKLLSKTPSSDPIFAGLVIPEGLYPIPADAINNKIVASASSSSSYAESGAQLSRGKLFTRSPRSQEMESQITPARKSPLMLPSEGSPGQSSCQTIPKDQSYVISLTSNMIKTNKNTHQSYNNEKRLSSAPLFSFNAQEDHCTSFELLHLPPLNSLNQDSIIKRTNHRSKSVSTYDAATLEALDRITFKFWSA